LCHTPIKPDLLGFPGIGVFACGEVESESDKFESEEMPPLVDCSDEEIAYPVEGEALVIRPALNMQIKEDDVDQQGKIYFTLDVTSKTRYVA
jgi:hypothetical protein